jgi:TetR/AcrR family transcriptional regulator, tetracycline repressor protein
MVKSTRSGTRERLRRDVVVNGAIALADAEGLDAVTIRRLAQDHGVTPMALYWHFREKNDLLDAMAERLLSDIDLPTPGTEPWDDRLRAVLTAVVAAMRPHPLVAGLTLTRVLRSDAGLAVADRVLGLLAAAGFDTEHASQTANFLLFSTVMLVTSEPGRHAPNGTEEREALIREKRAMLGALSPARYPHVISAAVALTECRDEERYFGTGVDFLVAGVRGVRPTV